MVLLETLVGSPGDTLQTSMHTTNCVHGLPLCTILCCMWFYVLLPLCSIITLYPEFTVLGNITLHAISWCCTDISSSILHAIFVVYCALRPCTIVHTYCIVALCTTLHCALLYLYTNLLCVLLNIYYKLLYYVLYYCVL